MCAYAGCELLRADIRARLMGSGRDAPCVHGWHERAGMPGATLVVGTLAARER